ncbi:MAG: transposase, partial [Desulfuromonadales bacterium]
KKQIQEAKRKALSDHRWQISNGIAEGLNNKAKVISHRAYGFRTAKNYILNLYHCMGNLTMPTTLHRFV